MRKLNIWIFIYFSILSSLTMAQVKVGILSGINSTGLSGDNPFDGSYASDYGYNLGGGAEFYFSEDVALNLQCNYSRKSAIVQFDVEYQYDPYDSLSVILNYIDIPLSVKVLAGNKRSYVTAGISLGLQLNAQVSNNRTGKKINISDGVEKIIWSANFGIGIQFHIGKPMLFIDLTYKQDLTNLTGQRIEELYPLNKLRSNTLQLTAGLLFTIHE